MNDRIIIENRRGGGCFGFLGLLLVAGLAISYWYIAVPVGVALAGAWVWSVSRPEPVGTYECVRCHADVTKGQVVCPMCAYDVTAAP